MKKPQRAQEVKAIQLDRARGALWGLAIGDALGAPLKGKMPPVPPFPDFAITPRREMTGKGPQGLRPGQVTAETHMACCIATSLRTLNTYDAGDVWKRYLAWRAAVNFDVPEQILRVFEAHAQGGTASFHPSRFVWKDSMRKLNTNTALARAAPIGVYFAGKEEERVRASLHDAALTHYDPRCQLACVALNGAIAAGLNAPTDKPFSPELMADGVTLSLSLGSALLGQSNPELVQETQEAADLWRAEMERVRRPDPELYGPEFFLNSERQRTSVRVAFRLAFWELLHAPSFEVGLLDVVNRGGDTDANAAVAGALLGTFYGEQAIPEDWRRPVMEASYGPRNPLSDAYHPRQLLALAGV